MSGRWLLGDRFTCARRRNGDSDRLCVLVRPLVIQMGDPAGRMRRLVGRLRGRAAGQFFAVNISSFERVRGPSLCLRLIQSVDAEYAYALRVDPVRGKFLNEVGAGVEDQRRWIERYKRREARGEELYYVIETSQGAPCGLVRLYEITKNGFIWGSWILGENKPPKAALESALLSFGVGFRCLGCEHATIDVRIENAHAISFYRRFGMKETERSAEKVYFSYDAPRFEADYQRLMKIVQGVSDDAV